MDNKNFEKQLEFLIEIDKLKTVYRKTKIMHGNKLENDAEHSWHLTMMAFILKDYANEEVDLLKVFKMLMVHDLVEIDAGDTFAYDQIGHADKAEREQKAADRIFGILPVEQKNELMALWIEFEERETAEAKYAAALDRLQPIIHNFNNEGDTWQKYGITSRQVLKRNEGIEDGASRLWEYVQDIVQQSVKDGFIAE